MNLLENMELTREEHVELLDERFQRHTSDAIKGKALETSFIKDILTNLETQYEEIHFESRSTMQSSNWQVSMVMESTSICLKSRNRQETPIIS